MKVSRRDFVKGAMGIAAMGVLGACASPTEQTVETQAAPATTAPVQAAVDEAPAAAGSLEVQYDVDVLIIGGGLAGLSAGIHAIELGCTNILIIDKSAGDGMAWGGSSMVCGGSYLIPVSSAQADKDAYAQAIYAKGQSKGQMELIQTLADGAYEGWEWLKSLGCEYGEPYSVFPANPEVHTTVADMTKTLPVIRDKFYEMGGTILYETKAVQLSYGSTGINGALVKGKDGYFNIAAKKVLLCTGGYAANRQFLEDHVGENGDEIMCRARESCTGDGIYLAQSVGGYTVNSCGMKSIHLSAVDPVYKEKGQPGNDIPNMIAINSYGKRFMDESLGSVRHGQAVFQQDVQRDGLIFDAKVLETVQATMDKLHGQGVVTWETNTLEEMAEIFGVDPDTLVATVEEFNAAVDEEAECTVGLEVNKTKKAKKIDTPPYYGIYPLVPGTSLTFGGIAINTKAEVLQPDGQVVDNLYAAGEGTGGFFYDDYFGGSCMSRCVVYGKIAIENAVSSL